MLQQNPSTKILVGELGTFTLSGAYMGTAVPLIGEAAYDILGSHGYALPIPPPSVAAFLLNYPTKWPRTKLNGARAEYSITQPSHYFKDQSF